jgi:hypothetical protein
VSSTLSATCRFSEWHRSSIWPRTAFSPVSYKTDGPVMITRTTVPATAADKMFAVRVIGEMDVKLTENYGQLRVADAAGGKPLSKVDVKVYARLADGGVKYHEDGYTDVRGRFDYAAVNTPERQAVERFAVLVLSDDRGAAIREAAPPQE